MMETSVGTKPKIQKPPRKSKLEEKSVKKLTECGSGEKCDDKNNEGESPAVSSQGRMTAIISKMKHSSPDCLDNHIL